MRAQTRVEDRRLPASTLRLAELLATRLCHDLSGPLGGLNVALGELPRDPEALAVAQDAMLALRRRFALLRAAWGAAPPALSAREMIDLAHGLANAHRLRVAVDARPPGTGFTPEAGRVALNMLLLAAECLPRGGSVVLSGNPAGQMLLSIDGASAAWPSGLGALLTDPDTAWEAIAGLAGATGIRALQAPLAALLAVSARVRANLLLARSSEAAPPLLLDFTAAS